MAEPTKRQGLFDDILLRKNAGKVAAERVRRDGRDTLELKKADLGWLGKFFGSKENAPTYIAAVFGAMCLLYVIFSSAFMPNEENWAIRNFIGPVLLAVVGYLFGRGSRG